MTPPETNPVAGTAGHGASDPQAAADGPRGRFIVLDGIDGCGKTTQAIRLVDALGEGSELAPLHLREPGSTKLGEELRGLLLDSREHLDPGVEALLLAAARRQMLRERVAPALAAGRDVVCERFHPSTFAYQAVAGDLAEDLVLDLLGTWAGSPEPDLVILLELGTQGAAARRGAATDRIEARDRSFHERVAQGYRRYAELHRDVVCVDASGSVDEVHREILAEVRGVRS